MITGFDATALQLLPTFLQYSHLRMTPVEADHMSTVVSIAYIGNCLLTFVVSFKWWSKVLIYINWFAILIGTILLVIYQCLLLDTGILIASSILMGMGFATMYPHLFSYCQDRIKLGNIVTGSVVCLNGILCAVLPVICGQYIAVHPLALPYMTIIMCLIGLVLFVILDVLFYRKAKSDMTVT